MYSIWTFVGNVPSTSSVNRIKTNVVKITFILPPGPALLQRLRDVIDRPKLRSKKWVSTSVPKEHWDEHNAKYSSPEYHTNNMLVCTTLTVPQYNIAAEGYNATGFM